MPIALTNVAVALFAMRNVTDRNKALATTVLSGYTPGLLGMAVPFVVARNDDSADSTGNGTSGVDTLVAVPAVGKDDEADARTAIVAAGLKPQVSYHYNERSAGEVIDQDPAAGETVVLDSIVTLRVSNGPPPDSTGTVTIEMQIERAIAAAKLEIESKIDDGNAKILAAMGSVEMTRISDDRND